MLNFKFYLILLICFCSLKNYAVEYYVIFDSKCNVTDGLMVNASPETITLVKSDGKIKSYQNSNIKGVLVYNFISSPIKNFELGPKTNSVLKKVTITSKDQEKSFKGFPVQFIEDLVVFIDTKGQTHVHSYNNIYKLRKKQFEQIQWSSKGVNQKLNLQNKGYIQSCENVNTNLSSTGIKPNRILADKIRINNFLENQINGFDQLLSFEEKTYVYARPMVFNKKTRLNLNTGNESLEQSSMFVSSSVYPSLEWSTGAPYRVQSHIVIGTDHVEYSENIDPMFAIRSEIKAHFFHASFVGNLRAMEAGKNYFVDSYKLNESPQDNEDVLSLEQFDTDFNYMILMGFDYSKFSFSAGLYYPIYLFQSREKVSEVLSTDSGYLGRFMYTNKKMRYFATVAVKEEDSNSPNDENILAYDGATTLPVNPISQLKIESVSLRLGVDIDFDENTRAGLNALYLKGKYKDQSSVLGGSDLSFSRVGALAYAARDFGEYVGLKVNLKYLANDLSGTLHSSSIKSDDSGFAIDGAFSIIF